MPTSHSRSNGKSLHMIHMLLFDPSLMSRGGLTGSEAIDHA
ncbi:hypothetical protein NOCA2540110 [metagenome]|uniref:Uncharacterized protein n=1 Tax=metagenome TaxID=256318 RepID=A0A2P2CAC7_9ZZZZ